MPDRPTGPIHFLPLLEMPTNEEWRRMLGREDLTDAEVDEFVHGLRQFLGRFLDEYLRDEFEPDEV